MVNTQNTKEINYMRILQDKKGNGYLVFSKQEIKLLNKKPYLTFKAEFLRKFANNLMHISMNIAKNQPKKLNKIFKKVVSEKHEEIESK